MTVALSRNTEESSVEPLVEAFMARVVAQSPGEVEFHQAVREVARSVMPLVQSRRAYRDAKARSSSGSSSRSG